MKTIVVVPTYNEAENVPPLCEALLALPVGDLSVLIVDDNSPDGTGEVAEELAAANPGKLHVLHRPGKQGLGRAYVAGFRRALEMGADAIVQMDADFSHQPSDVPRLLEPLGEYDLVIGSRYVSEGELDERWGWHRELLSAWANRVYVRAILGMAIKDATGGFRAWTRAALKGIDMNMVKSNGYIFQVEMAYIAEKLGYRILEVPIFFAERRAGRSKMDLGVQLEAALRVWQIWWRHRHLAPTDRLMSNR